MGKIKYELDKRFYMFAKANISEDFESNRINYNQDLFIYPFENEVIPDCIGIVPVVLSGNSIISIEDLNELYESYTKKVDRRVEGFVVSFGNAIKKYVRMKNGKLEEHKN